MINIPVRSIVKLYRSNLMQVLPYSLALALLYMLLEPKTKPTFADSTDWMALTLFIIGLFGVFLLHACIVRQMAISSKTSSDATDMFTVLRFGLRKMFPVFFMSISYLIVVALGLVVLVLPGLFLFIVGSMSLFVIVLQDTNPKVAFVESYRMLTPRWFSLGVTMAGLILLFSIAEMLADVILKEQVVFATLFSVVIRGLLWPLWYATMVTLFNEYYEAQAIEDSLDSKPSRRSRKQKFLHTAPNQ